MVNANARDPNSREIARVRNDLLSVENIPISLQRLHEGVAWTMTRAAGNIGAGAFTGLLFEVGADVEAHTRFGFATGGDVRIELFEAPTWTTVVAPALTSNRNRRFSSATPASTWSIGPSITSNGTLLATMRAPGLRSPSGTGTVGGSISQGFDEWILAADTAYFIKVTNLLGQAQRISLSATFYEVDAVVAVQSRAHL